MELTFPDQAHQRPRTRWDHIPELLRGQGIDVLVAISPENVTYTSGHYSFGITLLRDRISATVIPADGEPVYLVVSQMERVAKRHSWIENVAIYRENVESPIKVLAGILGDKGFGTGVIAIDEESLTALYYEELRSYLPEARMRNGSQILAKVRSVKTDEEVAFMEAAIRATETAQLKVYQTLKPGDTEAFTARRLAAQLLQEGADTVSHAEVITGRNTMEPHHIPDETPLRPGDVLWFDCGPRFAGYIMDLSRPGVVGQPSPRQRSMWGKLRDAQRKGIENVRVGVKAGEALAELRRQPEYEDIWFYGHGLGVFVHDAPMLTPYYENGSKTTTNLSASWDLEANMLIMVEFALVDRQDHQRYHLEDLILVTERGPRILSNVIDTTEMFVIE